MSSGDPEAFRTLTYTVTRADALAFAMVRHRLGAREKLLLLVLIGAAGLLAGLVPRDLAPVAYWSTVGGLILAGGIASIAWTNVDVRRRAAAVPLPQGEVTLTEGPLGLTETAETGMRSFGWAELDRVTPTDSRLIAGPDEAPLIVPLSAFGSVGAMQAFASRVETMNRRAAASGQTKEQS